MSPRRKIPPLSNLCVRFVASQLIQALSDEDAQNCEVIGRYLSDATSGVLQDLLKNILNSVNLDAATRFSCLQVLLRQDVLILETGMFPHSYYEAIMDIIAERGTGLRHLNLKGVWVRDYPELLIKVVKKLTKLKVLAIPHMANDDILAAILQINSLTILDISGECSFTLLGLCQLKSETISILDIGNFGKRELCPNETSNFYPVATIIENLPNLTSLRTYSFTGNALLLLHEKNPKFRTKLKYLHDIGTTSEIVKAIILLCPDLESILIDSPEDGVIGQLNAIEKLNSIKLVRYSCKEFTENLQYFGDGINIMKLNHHNSDSSRFDLSQICQTAPNLHTLELFRIKLSFVSPEAYFMHLENVEFSYCDIQDSALLCILKNSPFLRRIVMDGSINFTDGDMFRLCAECEFISLEELRFAYAKRLTSITVELLMGHCPNLKAIGDLNGWDIPQEEVDYLRYLILYTNTDLILFPRDSFL